MIAIVTADEQSPNSSSLSANIQARSALEIGIFFAAMKTARRPPGDHNKPAGARKPPAKAWRYTLPFAINPSVRGNTDPYDEDQGYTRHLYLPCASAAKQ
jgi:hypothetical protein